MILFGRKDKHLGLEKLEGQVCEKCGRKGVVVSLFLNYFHLLWLPCAPISRRAASQCLHCGHIEVDKKFDEVRSESMQRLKKQHLTPWWSFVGAFVLLLAVGLKLTLR